MPRRDGEVTFTERPIMRQPPVLERKNPANGPGGFDLEFSAEATKAMGEACKVRGHERGPGPGESLVGKDGAVRHCLLKQAREDKGIDIEDVARAALLTVAEVRAIEAGEADAEGDRERRRLASAVGESPETLFPFRRWPRHDFTLARPRYTGDPTEALGRRAPAKASDPQSPTSPPRRGGTPAEARALAEQKQAAETEQLAAEAKRLRDDLTLAEVSDGVEQVRAEIAEKSKTPLQRIRLKRKGR